MQNIEGVHSQSNQLVRRFGNTRGRRRQQLVMNQFLFSHSTWMVQTVDAMLRKTKRNVVRGDAEESEDEENNLTPLGQDGRGGGEGANPAAVHPGRRGNGEEAEDSLFPQTVTLFAMESRLNCNSAFHGFKNVDTKISACKVCKRRLLQFAAAVHCHEIHKEHTGNEINE